MQNVDHPHVARSRRRWFGATGGAILGWVLLFGGVAFLLSELAVAYMTGSYRMISAGEIWFDLDVASLNLAQAIIQRYIHPILWDPIIAGVLRWPVWSLLGGLGAFLVLAFPLRGDR
ncbi:MAG: hypothetical protein L0219_20745 [Phycisphaerales bacterium]|nr:hypothetical protein [Phycisphaerales bacterium]